MKLNMADTDTLINFGISAISGNKKSAILATEDTSLLKYIYQFH